MKKLMRIGTLLTTLGISLLLATVFRGSQSYIDVDREDLQPSAWSMDLPKIWSPRKAMLELISTVGVEAYLLDEAGIDLWRNEKNLQAIFSINQTTYGVYTLEINKRGLYAILYHNPSNISAKAKLSITLYGFENDILMASVSFIILGIVIITANSLLYRVRVLNEFSR